MSHSLNSLKGVITGSILGVTKGDTRSIDYNSNYSGATGAADIVSICKTCND